MHDRVTICGGVLGGHPRLVADEILALSVANCRSTWRWRDDSSAGQASMKRLDGKNPRRASGKVRPGARARAGAGARRGPSHGYVFYVL